MHFKHKEIIYFANTYMDPAVRFLLTNKDCKKIYIYVREYSHESICAMEIISESFVFL